MELRKIIDEHKFGSDLSDARSDMRETYLRLHGIVGARWGYQDDALFDTLDESLLTLLRRVGEQAAHEKHKPTCLADDPKDRRKATAKAEEPMSSAQPGFSNFPQAPAPRLAVTNALLQITPFLTIGAFNDLPPRKEVHYRQSTTLAHQYMFEVVYLEIPVDTAEDSRRYFTNMRIKQGSKVTFDVAPHERGAEFEWMPKNAVLVEQMR